MLLCPPLLFYMPPALCSLPILFIVAPFHFSSSYLCPLRTPFYFKSVEMSEVSRGMRVCWGSKPPIWFAWSDRKVMTRIPLRFL
mmetsp:Transcript_35817/g.93363  ORF Transcript_35817/g.93363 Transcript_35817/m.93363 type:complete len:84 (-) Transcript_35817:43-294(-)